MAFSDGNGGSSLSVQNREIFAELLKKEKRLNKLKEKVVSFILCFLGWFRVESLFSLLKTYFLLNMERGFPPTYMPFYLIILLNDYSMLVSLFIF
jgi:hypothetical protein